MFLLPSIVLIAFLVEAIVGFGSTVLAVTVGAHWMPIETILPALVPVNLLLSIAIVLRNARHVDLSLLLRRVAPMVALGTLFGIALFRLQSGRGLRLGFAGFVVTLAVAELIAMRRPRDQARPPMGTLPAMLLLLLGGVAHGLYGSGGPLVVYVAGREIEGKARFRATLSALWIALNGALILNYAISGMITRSSMRASLWLLPIVPVALLAGEWVHARVPERPFRVVVWCVLLIAGLALVLRNL